ncbi:MAG: CBS domain-containing protein [Deltaproteobacteria bacterium]|nr:CBS domain-containing protein [Deltaproteobacteria bacterium]
MNGISGQNGSRTSANEVCAPLDLSDEDIYDAMKSIPGYLDITAGDFKELYRAAYRHALQRIRTRLKAGDVMTRKVISVKLDTSLEEAAAVMAQHNVSGVPVLDHHGRVAGIISEHDFLERMSRGETRSFMGVLADCISSKGCAVLTIKGRTAADIMSSPPISVWEDTPVSEIASLLTEKRIHRAPVADREGFVRGMITRTDLLKASY